MANCTENPGENAPFSGIVSPPNPDPFMNADINFRIYRSFSKKERLSDTMPLEKESFLMIRWD